MSRKIKTEAVDNPKIYSSEKIIIDNMLKCVYIKNINLLN